MNSGKEDDDKSGGYGRPPISGRFRKGASANPSGHPKESRRRPPYEDLLGQTVQITDRGQKRRVPAHEALQLRLLDLALNGSNAALRAIETLEEERRSNQESDATGQRQQIIHFVSPGSVNMALEPLRMGKVLDRFNDAKARVALEPWLVEAALARFGARRLSRENQAEVVRATWTPTKVTWPDWWEVLPD